MKRYFFGRYRWGFWRTCICTIVTIKIRNAYKLCYLVYKNCLQSVLTDTINYLCTNIIYTKYSSVNTNNFSTHLIFPSQMLQNGTLYMWILCVTLVSFFCFKSNLSIDISNLNLVWDLWNDLKLLNHNLLDILKEENHFFPWKIMKRGKKIIATHLCPLLQICVLSLW